MSYLFAANRKTSPYAPGATSSYIDAARSGGFFSGHNPSDTAAPPPPAGGSADPNFFQNAIEGDPLYGQAKKDLSAQGIQDSATAAANIVRSLVQRGIVPDLNAAASKLGLSQNVLDFLKNNVDFGRAAALAKQATDSGVSEEARLNLAHSQHLGNIKDELAARGLARSGASPFLLGQEANNFKVQRFDADRQTADYINGAIAAFAQAERARQDQLRQAASDAATRQASLLGAARPTAPTPPPPPPPPPSAPPTSGSTQQDLRDLIARATRTHKNIAA